MYQIESFKNKYKSIKGIEKIFYYNIDFHYWSYLYKIQSIHIFKDYDNAEWKEISNLKLLLSTSDETLFVEFLFRNIVEFHLDDIFGVSDFEIEPNDDSAFGNERLFLVTSNEGYGMNFFCKEIEILNVSHN